MRPQTIGEIMSKISITAYNDYKLFFGIYKKCTIVCLTHAFCKESKTNFY